MSSLSSGAIHQICNGQKPNAPVLQVLEIKQMEPKQPGGVPRFRMVLSDGTYFQQSMLATQLNGLITENTIKSNSVIRLDDYVCNSVNGKNIIIIVRVSHVGDAAKVGEPVNINHVGGGAVAPPAPVQQQQQQQQQQRPQQGYQSAAATANAANNAAGGAYAQAMRTGTATANYNDANVTPIVALTMYSPRWTIKARVTSKSDFRTWVNDRGAGKLFSVDLLDHNGGEIRATMFNDDADRFHAMLQVGHVYYISKGQVKFANKRYNKLSHDYEITLNSTSTVEEAPEDNEIARVKWSFVPLASLAAVEADTIVDIIGVVTEVSDLSEINTKKGDTVTKRDVTVVDNSDGARQIRVTLWRDLATSYDASTAASCPVVAFKSLRVGDYQGKSLSSVNSSQVVAHPADVPEAVALRAWYDAQGRGEAAQSVAGGAAGGSGTRGPTPHKTFAQIHEEQLGAGESAAYFTTRATLSMLSATGMNWYPACPSEGCNKKVVQEGSGMWQCEKCQRQYEEPNYRYILNIGADDHTGMQYLTAFNEVGEKIMGATAKELHDLQDEDPVANEQKFNSVLMRKFNFKIKAKTEMYQQEPKLRCVILEADPVNFVSDTAKLISEIKAM